MNTRFLNTVAVLVAACLALLLLSSCSGEGGREDAPDKELYTQGFVLLDDAMRASGYEPEQQQEEHALTYRHTAKGFPLVFRFDEKKAYKDGYAFAMADNCFFYKEACYVSQAFVSSLVNRRITAAYPDVAAEPVEYALHAWKDMGSKLIAHAGGVLRTGNVRLYAYANNLMAVQQNYELGHRLFEIDMNLTSDHRLAATHDWKYAGFPDGAPSSEVWAASTVRGGYPTSFVDEILAEMSIHEDMFLIPDTKAYDMTQDEVREIYQVLVDTAKEIDPALLERIVPAFYNQEMYETVKSVYPFKSLIYTLYASPDTFEQVVEFVADKEDIPVVLTPSHKKNHRFITALHESGKELFVHTENEIADVAALLQMGVDGFITDFLSPGVMEDLYKGRDYA